MVEKNKRKGIVFCHCCNRIVGSSYPVDHYHDFGNGKMAFQMLLAGDLGLAYYMDTGKNRRFLAEHYPPRNEVTIKL